MGIRTSKKLYQEPSVCVCVCECKEEQKWKSYKNHENTSKSDQSMSLDCMTLALEHGATNAPTENYEWMRRM